MDYRIINAFACLLTVVAYFFYLKSGRYWELRVSVSLIALFSAYFGVVYVIAVVWGLDTLTTTPWLRPPFSADRMAVAILLVDMIWGEKIYRTLHRLKRRFDTWRNK